MTALLCLLVLTAGGLAGSVLGRVAVSWIQSK